MVQQSLLVQIIKKKRFEASNWNVLEINGHDFKSIEKGLKLSTKSKKPTLVICKTLIGYGSPNKSGTESSHGAPLGEDEALLTKKNLDWSYPKFFIPKFIKNKWIKVGKAGERIRKNWEIKNFKSKNFSLRNCNAWRRRR